MAKFKVTGADKESGTIRTEIVNADNSKEAEVVADARGMFITSVEGFEEASIQSQPQVNIINTNNNENINANEGLGYAPGHPGGIVPALLSFFIPGLGQLVKGQVFGGIIWFIVVAIGYAALVIPGLILHLCCIIGAAQPSR